jgi:hypothetical protein
LLDRVEESLSLGRFDACIAPLARVRSAYPEDPRAEALYERLKRLESLVPVALRRGETYLRGKMYQQCIAEMDKVLAELPEHAQARMLRDQALAALRSMDGAPPTIVGPELTTARVGENLVLTAQVADEGAVEEVLLHYRLPGYDSFFPTVMRRTGSHYEATIPGVVLRKGTLSYYISARDNARNVAYWGTEQSPKTITIRGG